MSLPARQRGFTLIEIVVAFAILALALTLLLGTLSGATKQIRWADDAGRAALHAESAPGIPRVPAKFQKPLFNPPAIEPASAPAHVGTRHTPLLHNSPAPQTAQALPQ